MPTRAVTIGSSACLVGVLAKVRKNKVLAKMEKNYDDSDGVDAGPKANDIRYHGR